MERANDFDWLAAVHTPFDSGGELALSCVEAQAENLLKQGVDGAFVCGSTGESLSLSVAERKAVARRWAELRSGTALSLWVHVGANALPDALELARDAADLGADAIALMPPCFFRPADEVQLVDWCEAVASASGGLPITYYETPDMSGVKMDMRVFVEEMRARVPSFRGLKYTDSNRDLFAELCSGRRDQEGLWWGRDEELLHGIEAGATGAIGSSYNYAGKLYEPILRLRAGGEVGDAQRAQERAVEMIELIASFGYFGAAKAVMGFLGVPVGPTRMPLGNPSAEELARLRAGLEELGFFDWVRV